MYNYDEGYFELENPIEFEEPKRRKNPKKEAGILNFKSPQTILLLAGAGYLAYCYFASKKAGLPFSLTPWKTAGIQQQQIAAGQQMRMAQLRAAQQQAQQGGQPADYRVGEVTVIQPATDPNNWPVGIIMP